MIDLSNISLQFNGKYLFRDVNLRINSGDKISLVGANGTGKSSFLKIISGEIAPETGKINKQKNVSIGYLPQENVTHSGSSLFEEAKTALSMLVTIQEKERSITDQLNESDLSDEERNDLVHQLGEIHHRLDELDAYSAESKIKKILAGLGFEENDFERLTDEFSGGWQMRIALAKLLISQNDLLLLDEPTNHLDIESLNWLINFIQNYDGALLIVSHDKFFVNRVTNKTLEIYLSRFSMFNGNYYAYLKFKDERDVQTENHFTLQQKKIKETEKFIERFRYKATKSKQVQSRIKQLEKIELVELPEFDSTIRFKFPEAPPSGRIAIELKSISKSFGDKKIFEKIDLTFERGEKVAFVGPNGAGKTTLGKILAGVTDFNGERFIGHKTTIAYYSQDVADNLNPALDLIETLEGIAENFTIGQLRGLLGSFLFRGDDVFKKVGVLSGGEKSRLALAKILLTKSNLIILDEPTNHLDVNSKLVLQNALLDFKGSLIVVSHDIDFLRPVISRVIEIRKGVVKNFIGGIEYYLEKINGLNFNDRKDNLEQVKDSSSRKDQKRIEAEARKKRFILTKDIIKQIAKLEQQISVLEKRQQEIETIISSNDFYSKPEYVKLTFSEYDQTKEKLDLALVQWAELTDRKHEIEKQFN
ncbi:MAG: ABC-F family ATP-binding cassette domain-containing protein [Ignavibacteriales bacterium]|nr:ABC-F family ATP-binding cassette domain-containing protein [Ignavibacteriales bacterium]